ncbi:MBL fold metallo-hydrolase [Salinifilum aidingensis]
MASALTGETRAPHVVTLGTVGGPRWWEGMTEHHSAGIATAVVVGDAVYLVDCGRNAGHQLVRAGLPISALRAVFLTHLHSDHTVDLDELAVFGLFYRADRGLPPVHVLGPGERGALPPVSARAATPPEPLFPENPTGGTVSMFHHLMAAHATDLNYRVLGALRPSPLQCFDCADIALPEGCDFDPDDRPDPPMEPFEVYQDERVRVTAILVHHPPVAPAYAFRFDTDAGSVTISGDTAPCENLVRIAEDTDLLLHEAIDFDWVRRTYAAHADEFSQASIDHHHRSHTSPEDAAALAKRAGARGLALHHLVPGNASRAVWWKAAGHFDGAFHVPSDLDVLPIGSTTPAPK